ncbi:MAG: alanine--tRNA ligase [Acidobacteriia bacterium]|nr:alanine--tRNA ligase [Terriglobia bacterium]
MKGNEVRSAFLRFFERNGHKVVKSSPLLPANDPTLLFANAGMNQFKDVFLGNEKRDYLRATSSQKCVRAGGKHNDLEEVGKTARHHTFFEMLGNFSFGDYFKEEAIHLAWDLLTRDFQLDKDRLWFTVYTDDDEALHLWKKIGAPADRILRFGEKENFWAMGETGPCGPCSEIHYFLGEKKTDNRADLVNGPGDTIMEIWNLVFMQFNRDSSGKTAPLPKPSVDTGMGLERMTAVMQGVTSNYESDLIRPIIDFISDEARKKYLYDTEDGVSMRVIADHARATAFLITDGVYPGNEGRAYVLRKIMRRALWHGKKLGMELAFLFRVTQFVADLMAGAYPELADARGVVTRTVTVEENLFSNTLAVGIKEFNRILETHETQHKATVSEAAKSRSPAALVPIPGQEVFRLYDTYGLREDLIEYIAEQRGFTIDWDGFNRELEKQRERARESWKGVDKKQVKEVYRQVASKGPVTFTGYEGTELASTLVRAIICGDQEVTRLASHQEGEVVLDHTPFYAESGGQIGDRGMLEGEDARAAVRDTYAPLSGLIIHRVLVEAGELQVGDRVQARVDAARRTRIMLNHSATHLLHAALREVLGPHVKQAGSLVAEDRLRFDFTHFAPLSDQEISEIERLVNEQIRKNAAVAKEVMDLDKALNTGALAFFGEKYSQRVRVVSVPGFSKELCGGTHVNRTGEIGLLKIVSESSISSGVRRIEAITGERAVEELNRYFNDFSYLAEKLRTPRNQIIPAVEKLAEQELQLRKKVETLERKLIRSQQTQSGPSAVTPRVVKDVRFLAREVENTSAENLRLLADEYRQQLGSGVVVLGMKTDGKVSLITAITKDLTGRLNAGKIVKEIATVVEGGGGGRADLAEAGGKNPEKLAEALSRVPQILERML